MRISGRRLFPVLVLVLVPVPGLRAEEPAVEHQPSPCTVPGKPITLCASITDDGQVAKARAITVYATSQKQGGKLPGAFDSSGVTFVPVGKR